MAILSACFMNLMPVKKQKSFLNFTPKPGSCTAFCIEPGFVFLGLPHFLVRQPPCNCDAIVAFNTPLGGQHVLTRLGAEQTTSSLAVMIQRYAILPQTEHSLPSKRQTSYRKACFHTMFPLSFGNTIQHSTQQNRSSNFSIIG